VKRLKNKLAKNRQRAQKNKRETKRATSKEGNCANQPNWLGLVPAFPYADFT